MNAEQPTSLTIESRPGETWLQRVIGSRFFATALSLGLHLAVFYLLCTIVFRDEPTPRSNIIPEARIADSVANQFSQQTAPLRMVEPTKLESLRVEAAHLSELPAAEVALDDPMIATPMDRSDTDPVNTLVNRTPAPMTGGPVTRLFGQAGNARKVVYVVDVSASLVIYLEDIISEMHLSIRSLLPTQWFHIILAKPVQVVEFKPQRLVPAISRYKEAAVDFIDTIRGTPKPGKADPVDAMRRAFACRPELIYFLTDGDYSTVEGELMRTLADLNRDRQAKITVIGFNPAPQVQDLLLRIARENGGHYRLVEHGN
jgi:hypothetical protein